MAQAVTDLPLAIPGLLSYRCKGRYGWIMIGAPDDLDALNEARRSQADVSPDGLQRWNGSAYEQCRSPSPV